MAKGMIATKFAEILGRQAVEDVTVVSEETGDVYKLFNVVGEISGADSQEAPDEINPRASREFFDTSKLVGEDFLYFPASETHLNGRQISDGTSIYFDFETHELILGLGRDNVDSYIEKDYLVAIGKVRLANS